MGYGGVCRDGTCALHVPCADDLECGLGEACTNGECGFVGCVSDDDCPTGRCDPDTFACAECGQDSDCPFNKPVCQLGAKKCVQCTSDDNCPPPGPGYCDAVSGGCVDCLSDDHCPNGLTCNAGACVGAAQGQPCPPGTACAAGLTCVTITMQGGTSQATCLSTCSLYVPSCPQGQVCYSLRYANSTSYIFDTGGLLGVCFTANAGARNLNDTCTLDANTGASNCQPSLQCVPDSPSTATCREFCDPGASANPCPAPELCHPFVGDIYGREYGLCYDDNGFGATCNMDATCKAGLACRPHDDPSNFGGLSDLCQYAVGTNNGLAPCASGFLTDGGHTTQDKSCLSGACRGDRGDISPKTNPYFCYAACKTDSDCNVGGRTGTCDGQYDFKNLTGTTAQVLGCRPGCRAKSDCDTYDAGVLCRARLLEYPQGNSGLKLNCGTANPDAGIPNDAGIRGGGPGAPCTGDWQCLAGYCSMDDARGVHRLGYCLEPCLTAATCTSPLGDTTSGPLDCLPTTYVGNKGDDFVVGTPDDELSVRQVCSGAACNKDEDCSTDGGARCAPDVSPLDAGAVVLRCRAPVAFAQEAGAFCGADSQCASGACGQVAGQQRCFQPCDVSGPSPCPGTLTCRAAAFTFRATAGNNVVLDGCAP
jgi:hypothetical protein